MKQISNLKWLKTLALIGLTFTMATAGTTDSQSPEEKGFAIAARSDRSDRGFGGSEVRLTMTLRNKAGKETQRSLTMRTLEVPDESAGDKSVILFSSPADIEGTALLSHAAILKPDDQWLYLPALKRVKRISSVNKSGPFVGSEFAFEDFTALELNKFSYKYLGEETLDGLVCDKVERYPKYEHSGYTKQVGWFDQKDHQLRKVTFYDRRGALLKTLTLGDYKRYADKYWRAHSLHMANHQTGKSTDLTYEDFQFHNQLDDKDFDKSVLNRMR